MVEVKATADDERGGCEVAISMKGTGNELIEETLALIQGVMGGLKDKDIILHLLAIRTIADHPEILLGEDESKEKMGMKLAEAMSKNILKKGVN